MTIQYEIKSQLAKLLATEDLIVEHKRVETACFNVATRVLTLPVWDTTDKVVDMLVSHEVGHALYTPNRDWWLEKEWKMNPSFVNIVEDARIEKMMKRRYEGISKTFFKGYSELVLQDFFQVDGKDITKMNLADRVNLHYKIGTHLDIPFTEDEILFVRRIDTCETFDQVLQISQDLFDYCQEQFDKEKEALENTPSEIQPVSEAKDGEKIGAQGSSESDSEEGENDGRPDLGEDNTQYDSSDDSSDSSDLNPNPSDLPIGGQDAGASDDGELKIETADALADALKNLAQMEGRENVYVELPKLNIDNIIIPNEEIHEEIEKLHAEIKEPAPILRDNSTPEFNFTLAEMRDTYNFLQETDKDFAKFKKSAQKEVNYLVKEFERRKSAGAYARTTTSRTGILDTKNLHTYKFNEDLFKKISIVPDGKNHGLVFVLDWSGSMSHVMQDTIKQLYNLVWFCKKVQIPFEVYAFTSSYNKGEERRGFYKERSGLISMDGNFSMMNLLSSKVRSKDFNQQLINLYRVVSAFRGYHNHKVIPIGLNLSGTPLNEAVITLHDIIPQFQKETGVEKVNCVILTDGEAQSTSYHREIQRRWEDEPYIGRNTIGSGVFLRNRKTGRSSSFGNEWYGYTKVFLRDISQTFPDVNFVGIRLMDAREGSRFILCNQQGDDYTEGSFYKTKLAEWRKNKSLVLDNKEAGFDVYLGLSTSAMNNDTEFEVAEDATKAQIKSAFTKTLKNKKMNKKILSKFVEMVA